MLNILIKAKNKQLGPLKHDQGVSYFDNENHIYMYKTWISGRQSCRVCIWRNCKQQLHFVYIITEK